jgi:hypothetical protein
MKLNITLPTIITGAALNAARTAPPLDLGWLSESAIVIPEMIVEKAPARISAGG